MNEPQSNAVKQTLQSLHIAYDGILDESIPARVLDLIVSSRRHTAIKAFTGVCILALGVLAGIFLSPNAPAISAASSVPLSHTAVQAHRIYASDKVYPVQVDGSDMYHLNDWLSFRLRRQIQLASLDSIGFRLVGARLLPVDQEFAAVALYESADQARVSVLIVPILSMLDEQTGNVGKTNSLAHMQWQRPLYSFAAAGDVGSTELATFQRAFVSTNSFK